MKLSFSHSQINSIIQVASLFYQGTNRAKPHLNINTQLFQTNVLTNNVEFRHCHCRSQCSVFVANYLYKASFISSTGATLLIKAE